MKKIVSIFILLCSWTAMWAASYGILVNGKTYYEGIAAGEFEGFTQYLSHVQVQAGDYCQLCDASNHAVWAVALNSYSVSGFTYNTDLKRYDVSVSGCFDFYIKLKWEADELYIGNGSDCGEGEPYGEGTSYTAVPSQCTDVMMQAFYNESYQPNNSSYGTDLYGDTKWASLLPQAQEIGTYFDLVWLPPSSLGDGMGYHPKNYGDQNSNWGTRAELEALIAALHNAGSKVVADVVINHCTGWSTWCDFPEFDFGEYGVFHPDASYICASDEVNAEWNKESAGACWGAATGPNDDGENWDGARDWAHDAPKVQEMFKAYLQWLRAEMKYDGFRYDKGDGFNNWHHDNYNKAAKPYIAFMESYNGNDRIIPEIQQANYNLMALDFVTRWDAMCAISGFDYSKCQGSGLLGAGYAKYAVTFIDSHDWFLRTDNGNEFGGYGNSMKAELKDRLMQANAFMLGMPGVPCVFYPHWAKYKEDLKPMIDARHAAGVHSESHVSDEYADHDGYQCTVRGKYGWLILQLGNRTSHSSSGDYSWLADYTLMAKGPGYAMWVNVTDPPLPTPIESVETDNTPVITNSKILKNGQLYITRGNEVFDLMGRKINSTNIDNE